MVYFLYGADVFSSRQKLHAIQAKFLESNPDENLNIKNADELTPAGVANLFLAQTLLGGKRLVIVKNLLSAGTLDTKEAVLKFLKSNSVDDLTVIFYESQSFDKRIGLYKFLNQPKLSQEFSEPTAQELYRRVRQLAQTKNLTLPDSLLHELIAASGGDVLTINNELDKLKAYGQGRSLTPAEIHNLLVGASGLNIFSALESLAADNFKGFLTTLNQQIDHGEDIVKILGALTYQLRGAVQILELSASGHSPSQIARLVGRHPFAVSQTIKAGNQKLTLAKVKALYQLLAEVDHKFKTGRVTSADIPTLLVLQGA